MEGNRCIIASKIYVHFTRIYQGAAKLTQKLKYTCEHIRCGKKPTEVNHCNWMKKKSVQVAIIMTIFSKTYTVIKRNLNEKCFEHLFMYLRFPDDFLEGL
jgi:hypothetical protein